MLGGSMTQSHIDLEPIWTPDDETVRRSNIWESMQTLGIRNYDEFHSWSTDFDDEFWQHVTEKLQIKFLTQPQSISSQSDNATSRRWLPGAKLNIAESCFQAAPNAIAVICGRGDGELKHTTYAELYQGASRVANGLKEQGLEPGDAIALFMPMNTRSLEIYLGAILGGFTVVSIADSLAREQVKFRLEIGDAKLVFTVPFVKRGDKQIQLKDRAVGAGVPIVLASDSVGSDHSDSISWEAFVSTNTNLNVAHESAESAINVLFSSGTTSEPKAIPWDHITPIRCASDGHFHHDIHPGDVVAWPTSFGWMMGPWLTFSTLINRGTIALFEDSPLTEEFGQFVERASVNILGVVPSMVSRWRQTGCMESSDLSSIRLFSSTGECSNQSDMRYLSQLAGGKPIIEYCGGTEVGGGYVSSTVIQPNIASAFSTPTLGTKFQILDEDGEPAEIGEAFLCDSALGMSRCLLNADHDEIYYRDVPDAPNGKRLRRHGDQMQRLPNGYYAAMGRADDTLNLGGIKVGCAEIERAIASCDKICEVAVIGVPQPGGGPTRLVACVGMGEAVLDKVLLHQELQSIIKEKLSPLYHLNDVWLCNSLPRTASNKILRRELRKAYLEQGVLHEVG
jgi:acetyl-CoA synthetase